MPTIPQFDPPAFLDDFNAIPNQRDGWSRYISAIVDRAIRRVEQEVGTGNSQFYNETQTSSDDPIDAEISWPAFPQTLIRQFGRTTALRIADEPAPDPQVNGIVSRLQDEYLEWQVTRDPVTDKIVRITFTCEGPEYWQSIAGGPSLYNDEGESPRDFGATGDRDLLLQLYRDILGTQEVQIEDLFFADNPDTYNPWNKWNTTEGIVHLQQINNTLGAEINIGADGTIRRQKGGVEIRDATRLICCGGFGGVERASDPHLGDEVNKRARRGFAVTLRNPIGIYINGFDESGFTKPDPGGSRVPAQGFFKILRPIPSGPDDPGTTMPVRAVYEVPVGEVGPDGQQLTVGDIQIAGAPINFGGQVAERITMKFVARVCRPGQFNNPPRSCRSKCCRVNGILRISRLNDPCTDVFPVAVTPLIPAATALTSTVDTSTAGTPPKVLPIRGVSET
jgi:hypothetical protein